MIDMQYHTPLNTSVNPTVRANRRMCTRRCLIPLLFLSLMSGLGEHLFVFMPTDLLSSLLNHIAHESLQYLLDVVINQSTITLVWVRSTPGRP